MGKTAGHTDVSIWYAFRGDMPDHMEIDETEFKAARWFRKDKLPENADLRLPRFVAKLYRDLA